MLEWIALINHRKPSSLTSLPKPPLSVATRSGGVPLGQAAPEVEHDVDAGLTAGQDIRQACPALRVGHAEALEFPAQNVLADHARIARIGHGVAAEQVGDGRAAAAKLKRPHLRAGLLFHQQEDDM